MKKNVLFVVDEKMMGGVSVLLSDILNRINISKYNIDVLVLHNRGDFLNDLPKGVNIIYGTKFFNAIDYTIKEVLKSGSISKIFNKTRVVFLMKTKLIGKKIVNERKKILNKKYDVEIAFKDGFCALFTAYGDSVKKYHWLHTDYLLHDCTSKYHNLFQEVFLKFDKIIAISQAVLNRFKEKYNVSKTDVIYNIVNQDKIVKLSKEEEIKFDKNKINLISIGRIHEMKGYDRLVDVLHKLDEENKLNNIVVRIIGDGPDINLVKEKVKTYGLEEKVILMGRMKNPYTYLRASDCFIMCSRYEAFGLVIIEALSVGVPVLSLDVASIREIPKVSSEMIYENSFEGLYQGIKDIIDNPKKLDKIKEKLKDYRYDIKKIVMQIEKLLDE